MIVWKYRHPGGVAFGCPVTVCVPGWGDVRAVYQFQGGPGDQPCAVVHHPSGRIMALVTDDHTGYPQQRAQAAVDEQIGDRVAGCVWSETLNFIGAVV